MNQPARLLIAGIIAAAIALACGGNSSVASDVTGTWQYTASIAGSGTTMNLTQLGTSVSGSGESEVEAGAARPFTVTGQLDGAQLSLAIAYDAGTQASYSATVSADTLTGDWTESGSTASRTFTRQP